MFWFVLIYIVVVAGHVWNGVCWQQRRID